MNIKSKVILVTGAGSGIGEATARKLAELGGKVVLADIATTKLKKMEKELPGSYAVPTDMTNNKAVKNLITKTIKKFGRIDILINDAGQGLFGKMEDINLDDYRAIMDLNVYGYIRAMQAVIPVMRKQGGGLILNVSSGVSKGYYEELSAYSSTKYALNAMSLIGRKELAADNIRICLMHPNATATPFYKNALGNKSGWGSMVGMDSAEHVAESIAKQIKSEKVEIEL